MHDTKSHQFSFTPYAGFEFSDKFTAGLQFNMRTYKYEVEDVTVIEDGSVKVAFLERNTTQYGGGLFARYTLNPENKLNVFLQPYADFQLANSEKKHDSNIVEEETGNYLDLGMGLELLYQINDRWRATIRMGGLSYIIGKWEVVDTDLENDFSSFYSNARLSTINLGFEMKL